MVCREVHRIAYFYLDGTLEQQRQSDIKRHLDDCPDCDGRFQIHRRIRNFIQKRLDRVTAPDSLKARITVIFRAPGSSPA